MVIMVISWFIYIPPDAGTVSLPVADKNQFLVELRNRSAHNADAQRDAEAYSRFEYCAMFVESEGAHNFLITLTSKSYRQLSNLDREVCAHQSMRCESALKQSI